MPSATELLTRVVCSSSQQALVKLPPAFRLQLPGHGSSSGGEPFFKSLSEFSSDPRRRAEAPVVTYSALSSRWRGLSVSDVRTCPTPYALDALAQPSNRILAPQRSWAGQHAEAVTSARNSHGSIAVMPGFISLFQISQMEILLQKKQMQEPLSRPSTP